MAIRPIAAHGIAAVALIIAAAAPLHAQDRVARSFEQLQILVKPGNTISVEDATGQQVSGRIVGLSTSELILAGDAGRQTFRAGDQLTIRQRRGDSLRNGMWIGLGTGVGIVLAAAAADDSGLLRGGFLVFGAGVYGAMGLGIGAGVDALVRGRPVIYDSMRSTGSSFSVTVSPIATAKTLGASATLRF